MTIPRNFYYPYSDRMDEPDVKRAFALGWEPSNGRHSTLDNPGGRWQQYYFGQLDIVTQEGDEGWTGYYDAGGEHASSTGHATFIAAIEWCIAQRRERRTVRRLLEIGLARVARIWTRAK